MFKFYFYSTVPSTFSTQKQKYLEIFEYFNRKSMVGNDSGTSVNCLLTSHIQRVKSVLFNCRSHLMASFNAFQENKRWEKQKVSLQPCKLSILYFFLVSI